MLSPARMISGAIVWTWLLCFGALLVAQVTTATISGNVSDQSGAVIPGVTIIVTNVDTGRSRIVETNEQGRYRVPELLVGAYELRVTLSGFQTSVRRGITLTVGREAVVDFSLSVGAVAESVEVTGEAPLVNTVSGALSGLVTQERIEELPLNGRDLSQLLYLEAGVTFVRRGGSSATGGFGKRISIAGARPTMVGWSLDGTDIQTALKAGPSGAAGVQLGVESVREFQVLTNSYTAEYGSYAGGVVNAVTKSGTNALHGSIFEFLRNSNLDARNFFDDELPEFKRNQFGGSVGGPILRDRTFFFGAYEGLRQRLATSSRTSVPNEEARKGILPGVEPFEVNPFVKTLLDFYPLPNREDLGDGTGDFFQAISRPTTQDNLTVRVDHAFSDNHFIFGRYTFDDAETGGPDSLQVLRTGGGSRRQYVTVEETSILGPQWLNKIRAGYNRSLDTAFFEPIGDISGLILTPRGFPANFDVPDISGLGLGVTTPRLFILNQYELTDDLAYSTGSHNMKFGFQTKHLRFFQNQDSRAGGQWRFESFEDFLKGTVENFDTPLPGTDGVRNWRQELYGFYVQDSFRVLPRLTLNLGLRWEFVTTPEEINGKSGTFRTALDLEPTVGPLFDNPSLGNLAPRFGFAWDPLGDGKTSVRGGFGMFYDQLLPSYWRTPGVRMPPFFVRGEFSNPPIENTFEHIQGLDPSRVRFDFTSIDFDIDTPYLLQYNFNIERQLSSTVVAKVSYAASRGIHMERAGEANTVIPTILPDGRKCRNFTRHPQTRERGVSNPLCPDGSTSKRNPIVSSDRRTRTDGMSFYNALLVSVQKRFSDGFHVQGSYTWSKAIDEGSSVFSASLTGGHNSPDLYDHTRQRGLALFDVRHNFVVNYLWDLPWGRELTGAAAALLHGWRLGGILTMQSGLPDTPLFRFDNSGSGWSRNRFEVPNLVAGASNNPVLPKRRDRSDGTIQYLAIERGVDAPVFELAEPGFLGNLGRNTIIGPGIATFDLSLYKNNFVPAISEQFNIQFRAEFFNVFNRVNFDRPSLRNVLSRSGQPSRSDGRIDSINESSPARQIQFGLRVVF